MSSTTITVSTIELLTAYTGTLLLPDFAKEQIDNSDLLRKIAAQKFVAQQKALGLTPDYSSTSYQEAVKKEIAEKCPKINGVPIEQVAQRALYHWEKFKTNPYPLREIVMVSFCDGAKMDPTILTFD